MILVNRRRIMVKCHPYVSAFAILRQKMEIPALINGDPKLVPTASIYLHSSHIFLVSLLHLPTYLDCRDPYLGCIMQSKAISNDHITMEFKW